MYLLLAKKCLGDTVGHSSEESGKRLPSCVDEMQSNVNIADMGGKQSRKREREQSVMGERGSVFNRMVRERKS